MTDTDFPGIAKRRATILDDLGAISDTPPTLVAVTKTQPDEALDEILATGQRVFGENRVQEAYQHWETRRADYPDLELRLIGPLQSNKAEDAVNLFHVIETLDRPKLCRELAKAEDKTGLKRSYLIQVNTGEEPQKAGVSPAEVDALLAVAREHGLDVVGLMCIPPVEEPAGPHFALLARIARRLGLSQLSMGMSADYDIGARFGATHVRVGSALFGPRDYSA
jgi:PLP dependent protein